MCLVMNGGGYFILQGIIQRIGSAALMFIREVQPDVMRLSRGALLTVFTVELTVQQEMHLQNYS